MTRASASGSSSSRGSAPSTRAPNHASTVHHTNEPISVMAVNTPERHARRHRAGSDTRWRTTGSRRAKKIPAAE